MVADNITRTYHRSNRELIGQGIGRPVSFSAAEEMVKMLAYQEDYRVLVLDMSNVPVLDYTASYAIKDMIVSTHEAG